MSGTISEVASITGTIVGLDGILSDPPEDISTFQGELASVSSMR